MLNSKHFAITIVVLIVFAGLTSVLIVEHANAVVETLGNNIYYDTIVRMHYTTFCYLQGVRAYAYYSGKVDNMTVRFGAIASNESYQCAMYVYGDNTTNFASTILGSTETKTVYKASANTSVTFNFSTTFYITCNRYYYLCIRQTTENTASCTNNIKGTGTAGEYNGFYVLATTPISFGSPLTGEVRQANLLYLYASITVDDLPSYVVIGNTGRSSPVSLHASTNCILRGTRIFTPYNGVLNNCSVIFSSLVSTEDYECAIYSFNDSTTDYAMNLLEVSSQRTILSTDDNKQFVFNFSGMTFLEKNVNYYACVRAVTENTGGSVSNTIKAIQFGTGSPYDSFKITSSTPIDFSDVLISEVGDSYRLAMTIGYTVYPVIVSVDENVTSNVVGNTTYSIDNNYLNVSSDYTANVSDYFMLSVFVGVGVILIYPLLFKPNDD